MDELKRAQAVQLLQEMREDEALAKQIADVSARQMKIYYDALLAAGFTPDEALEITIAHGLNFGRVA